VNPEDFVECTTTAKAKRHWSLVPGAQWRRLVPLRKRTVIADLPACKQCEKSRQRRLDGRPT
jgi:hypothetical protein